MKKRLIGALVLLNIIIIGIHVPRAQGMSSSSYKMDWVETSTSGQGSATSSDYRVTYASGSTAIGSSTSENFVMEWGTVLAQGSTFFYLPLIYH